MEQSPSKLNPALVGGTVMGVLSTLPMISAGNCLCCMWVLLGGAVASYAYRRRLPPKTEMTLGEGALVGLLSGVFGALIGSLLGYLFAVLGFDMARSIVENFLDRAEDVPGDIRDWMEGFIRSDGFNPMIVALGLVVNLTIDCLFGTTGGVIGAVLFGKKKPSR